ncbi:MAG: hypothetical protein AAB509_00260 [Patescibacteria group bacterium]
MAKKNGKKITIDQLAIIINDGFNGQTDYLKEQFGQVNKRFEQVDKRFDAIEKDVKYIKGNLTGVAELEKDVEYIKNTLNIPELKK